MAGQPTNREALSRRELKLNAELDRIEAKYNELERDLEDRPADIQNDTMRVWLAGLNEAVKPILAARTEAIRRDRCTTLSGQRRVWKRELDGGDEDEDEGQGKRRRVEKEVGTGGDDMEMRLEG